MRINEEFEDLLLQNLEEEEYENRLNRQGD